MAATWKLTVQAGPDVSRERLSSLDAALDALGARLEELRPVARREARSAFGRDYGPAQQVAARLTLAGLGRVLPPVHAGVDLRGDGSSEAWTGRVRRELVELEAGEDAVDGLRRVLGTGG